MRQKEVVTSSCGIYIHIYSVLNYGRSSDLSNPKVRRLKAKVIQKNNTEKEETKKYQIEIFSNLSELLNLH